MKELDAITARLKEIEPERETLRARAAVLAVAALKKKVPPTEVANRSPYTAAHLRKLARDAGIPPATRGIKPRRAQDA